jgi:hypothetical protein
MSTKHAAFVKTKQLQQIACRVGAYDWYDQPRIATTTHTKACKAPYELIKPMDVCGLVAHAGHVIKVKSHTRDIKGNDWGNPSQNILSTCPANNCLLINCSWCFELRNNPG